MTTIASSTQTPMFQYPNNCYLDRPRGGFGYLPSNHQELYALIKTAANDFTPYRTQDNGATWVAKTAVTRASIQEWSSINADIYGFFWAYRTNESSQDRIYFRYYDYATQTWTAEQ